MAQKYVNLNLNPLRKYRKTLRDELMNGTGADNVLMTFGRRYLAYLRERFRVFRAGGGDWPPLAPATLAQKKTRIGILDVTGAIFNALRPGQPGNLFQRINYGIRVGFGGSAKHPDANATIAEVAIWHNDGTPNIPQRKIIVRPDAMLEVLMRADAKRFVERQMKKASK